MPDFESLNRRLSQQVFIQGPADRTYFNDLICDIRGLERTTDKLTLPEMNEAGAWSKAFALREALLRRDTDEPHLNPQAVAEFSKAAAQRTLWNLFCTARHTLEEASKRENSWRTISEYLELREGDLEPRDGEQFPGWREVHGRVSYALHTLERMTPADREQIPSVLRQRRADANAISMAQRIAELEKALSIKQATELVEDHGQ
jgi:hypothetical protein